MKSLGILLLTLFASCVFCSAGSDLPQAFAFQRYEAMVERSPFALATPAAKDPTQNAPFAAELYVTGLGRIGNTDCVFIASRDQQRRYTLISGETGPEDLRLRSVEWSDQVGKSRVTISKGEESGVLEFDQAVVQAPPAPPSAGTADHSAPPPPVNPVVTPQSSSKQWTGSRRPGETRRRIRVIPSRP